MLSQDNISPFFCFFNTVKINALLENNACNILDSHLFAKDEQVKIKGICHHRIKSSNQI